MAEKPVPDWPDVMSQSGRKTWPCWPDPLAICKVSISWADNAYKQEEKGNNIKPIEEVRVTGSGE